MTGYWFLDHLWLVPLLPFIGFIVTGLFLGSSARRTSAWTAIAAVGLSAVCGWGAAFEYFSEFNGEALVTFEFPWIEFSSSLTGNAGILADRISILLVLVVTTISFLIHVYSQGYMHGDRGYRRFFAFMNLFTFSMLGLVLSSSILEIFVFWELVGLSSFLLIGFYWERPAAVAACKKAFIVTRFADLGFLIGLLVLSYHAGSFDFRELNSPDTINHLAGITAPFFGCSILTLSALLVFAGAAGKSAMFPLHIWLPDAMEGPTPVSALIHAATMVVAGVYLVARLFPMFSATTAGIDLVMWTGAFTCLFAALIAITQVDIKRVLAFSTLSQIGYMMLALGVASMDESLGYTASMFHLTTHACFKALLFLCAGSVIHAVHSNDVRDMGGLRKKMPITHFTFLIACLAIAGVPPLSGFFSKDEILAAALHSGEYAVFAIAATAAGLTAFYMFRIYLLTFWNAPQDKQRYDQAHESPLSMTFPLVVLAVPSALLGIVPFSDFVHISELEHHATNWMVVGVSTTLGLCGIALAFLFYFKPNQWPARFAFAFSGIYKLVFRKFYIDELYIFITHKIIFRSISRPLNWFDRHIIDGFMDLTAQSARRLGAWLRKTATGGAQVYLLWSIAGAGVTMLALHILGAGIVVVALSGVGAAAVTVFIFQFTLQLLNKSEPLKRIEID
ncbi:MAG: NADH-quinone oxidoreductase subunit L [Verrucomicrobia bacterium]|nr:NADH-quinone oxidoreductase subunit L [Verrucomicrobiota bacterium]MCF7708360.1 NADH-quinone oxidoreductase subunit L [Verrucomicrobiota bacterium]